MSPVGNSTSNTIATYSVTVTDAKGFSDDDTVINSNPTISINTTDTSCGIDNGTITFNFRVHPNRSGITFSINNQANYTSVADNLGSYTFLNLSVGTY
ncbi:hypothetical protein [Maribacter spongiicola]|uniref:hypothetical protein n=1 Tax=Maribacter spongiicola TaxID=1206753 RepID=UPI00105EC3AD|nr:hypothetical protein [Maribacter spongiicola]